jgi:hypothetical protein
MRRRHGIAKNHVQDAAAQGEYTAELPADENGLTDETEGSIKSLTERDAEKWINRLSDF